MGSFGGKTILWQEGDYRIIEDMEVGERWAEVAVWGVRDTNVVPPDWFIRDWVRARPDQVVPKKISAKALDYGIVLG